MTIIATGDERYDATDNKIEDELYNFNAIYSVDRIHLYTTVDKYKLLRGFFNKRLASGYWWVVH